MILTITLAQLDQLKALAMRDHSGTVDVHRVERDGLEYLSVAVLLTDMSNEPPLHMFLLSPRGVLSSA